MPFLLLIIDLKQIATSLPLSLFESGTLYSNKPRKLTKDLLTGLFLLYLLVYLIPDYESDPLSIIPIP